MRKQGLAALLTAGLIAASCGGDEAAVSTAPATSATSATSAAETVAEAGTTTQAGAETTAATVPVTMPDFESAVPITAGAVLLREDFQDGIADGWENDGGWYALTNEDRVVWAAADESWAWYGEGLGWSDYALRLAFRTEEGGLAVSVGAGADGRYVVQIAPDGVFLLRDSPYGAFTPLASAAPVAAGAWHVLAIGYHGGHLQVYVDRVLLINHLDPEPLGPGTVAVGGLPESYVAVDNVIVNELSGPLPGLDPIVAVGGGDDGDGAPEAPDDPGPDVDPPEVIEDEPEDPDLADLRITDVLFRVEDANQPIGVTLAIQNSGGVAAEGFVVRWEAIGVWCETEGSLQAGEITTVLCESAVGLDAGEHPWAATIDPTNVVAESDETDNVFEGRLEVGGGINLDPGTFLPDLTPSWTAVSPEEPHTGDPIALQVGVAQVSPGVHDDLPAYTVRVSRNGNMVCSYDLYPGDEVAVCEIPPFANPGFYVFDVVVDADNDVDEGDGEGNNTTQVGVEIIPPGERRIDLWLTLSHATEVGVGEQLEVSVRWSDIFDGGEVDEPFLVQVDVEGVGIVCEWSTTLVPGGETCILPGWDAPGEYQVAVLVDPGNVVVETADDNNVTIFEVTVE